MKSLTRIGILLGTVLLVPALATLAAPPEGATTLSTKVETVDLASLADGESRTFGKGEDLVTATRRGDEVEIVMARVPEGGEKILKCSIGKDNCQVITTSGEGHTMLFVGSPDEKGHGAAFVGAFSGDGTAGEGHEVVIFRKGEGEEGMTWVEAEASAKGGEAGTRVVRIGKGDGPAVIDADGSLLRCPEGDTTMSVKKDELATPYFCPKHNRKLEEVKGTQVMRRVIIEKNAGEAKP